MIATQLSGLKNLCLTRGRTGEDKRDVVERLRVDFRAAGFKVRPTAVSASKLARALESSDFDLVLTVVPGGRPAVLELAEVAALLGIDPPTSLLKAAAATDTRR